MMLDHLFVALWVLAGWKKICKKGYERPVLTSPQSTSTKACRSSKHISMHMLRHTHTVLWIQLEGWNKIYLQGLLFFFFLLRLFFFSLERRAPSIYSLLFCGVLFVFRWSQLNFWMAIHEVTDLSSTRQYLALHSGSFLIQLKWRLMCVTSSECNSLFCLVLPRFPVYIPVSYISHWQFC